MKIVILAGGYGSRLYEKTKHIPKPMVKIGGIPILYHIMQIYLKQGFSDFLICGGYKQNIIRDYFKKIKNKNFKMKVINTGLNTLTGGRLKKLEKYLSNEKYFFFTYGDGVSDINLKKLLKFHIENKKIATVTAVIPPGRYGVLNIKKNLVKKFSEKKKGGDGYINGGFFVLSPKAINYIKDENTVWEKDPMEKLSKQNQLAAYIHNSFWQSMDTYRDKLQLEKIWKYNNASWKIKR
ncbi:sugar phosphate nucleotidyltransferase [Pelagibacteraceae bacterium]|nr:sugar phosphate nucleotidyltransferase [Pelagibacteraceae bacterium]